MIFLEKKRNFCLSVVIGSRESAVGIATGYRLDRVEFEYRQKQDFSPLHVVQIGSGRHPASNLMGTGGSFPVRQRSGGSKADHSHQTNREVKKKWIYTSTPPYTFMT
jgi:hypothetical protein